MVRGTMPWAFRFGTAPDDYDTFQSDFEVLQLPNGWQFSECSACKGTVWHAQCNDRTLHDDWALVLFQGYGLPPNVARQEAPGIIPNRDDKDKQKEHHRVVAETKQRNCEPTKSGIW